jgi:histidinol-phosphate aminotransferase
MDTLLDRRRFVTAGLALGALSTARPAPARKATGRAAQALKYPILLSGNENPYGPGPAARAAIARATEDACRYGMQHYARLVEKIASIEGVNRERIVIGVGSGELLHMLALSYCDRGQLVCAWPTFAQITAFAEKLGCEVRRVPLDAQLRHDLGALDAAVTPNTDLLYVCNPNNPTGTVIDGDALRDFCARQAQRTLVVVDEAYLELVDDGATRSMAELVRSDANVVVLRTFSKIHGLAGLRIGYSVSRPDIAARLRRLQMAYPSIIGMQAAAASLDDHQFLDSTRAAIIADRQRVMKVCDELKLRHGATQGNFVFMQVGMPAADFAEKMRQHQIEVGRPFEPLGDFCRVSIGTRAETSAFVDALRRTLA